MAFTKGPLLLSGGSMHYGLSDKWMTLFFKVSYLGLSSLQTIGIKISGKEYGQIIGSMLHSVQIWLGGQRGIINGRQPRRT